MFLSLSDFLFVVFLFVSFFCYNVVHLRWVTVVAHLRSPPGKSHRIRSLPRYHLFHPLTFHRNQSPFAHRSSRLTFGSPNPRSSVFQDPTGSYVHCIPHTLLHLPILSTSSSPPWARRTTTENRVYEANGIRAVIKSQTSVHEVTGPSGTNGTSSAIGSHGYPLP